MLDTAVPAEQPPESWMRHYGNGLLQACYVQLRDRQLAQDALQETLLKAWQAWKRDPGKVTAQRAWLHKIAANTCRDFQRSAWFRHVDRSVVVEDLTLTDDASPEDGLLFWEVLNLPEKLRQAVVLYYDQGLTLAEIAQVAGTNPVMIHRRLKKARALLKMQAEEGENRAR